MGSFFEQFLNLTITIPGNLVYHLFVIFSVGWSLSVCYNHWRFSSFPQALRAVIGLLLLLGAQFTLLTCAIIAQTDIFSIHIVLPPADRAVALFSLTIIIWLWVFPEAARLGDAIILLLSLFIIVLVFPAIGLWGAQANNMAFNATWYDIIATGAGIGLAILGCLLLVIRRPNGWGIGLSLLLLLMGGYIANLTIAYQPDHDYVGIIRLTQIAAYPLLLALPMRFPLPIETENTKAATATITEKRRYNSDPRLIQEFLELASKSSKGQAYDGIARVVSQMMVADLGFVVSLPEGSKQLNVSCGYDLIREKVLESFSIDERLSPIISSALRRGRPVRLPASSTSPDLLGFAKVLGLGRVGHMLIVPFPRENEMNLRGLVLVSPYSNRGWTMDDQSNLSQIAELMALILQQNQPSAEICDELEYTKTALEIAKKEIEQLQKENENLLAKASQTKSVAATLVTNQEHHSNKDFERVKEQLQLTLDELARLQDENQQLQIETKKSSGDNQEEITQLEEQLRISLEEITRLNERLFEADQRLLESQLGDKTREESIEDAEVIAAMAQELRQPMFSIIGYTDLLLGESLGLLGATQRKFVERVKAAGERLGALVEDLIGITSAQYGQISHPESVNLGAAIDEAITASEGQFREKNIALRVNLPEKMPEIQADRDALQQILIHLLQNAGQATPGDGEISLQAQIEGNEKEDDFVLIRVSDTGEGIAQEELPRVFSRLYRADNALIPGVGDTGVGLSIVKTLVEAQNGRIWVDSEKGQGSTFSVLLPLAQKNLSLQRLNEQKARITN